MTALVRFCVRNPLITLLLTAVAVAWGWHAWTNKTVDAIPDISENQTVVVTEWPGRSPQDVEDQITYPLSSQLAGVAGVKEVRGLSGFGFSQVYVVFENEIRFFQKGQVEDFYEARTRVLEKLASVGKQLPPGVVPELGPDATALGQVFWYTVDGPYDLATLRSVQDWVVRYDLQTVPGVAEVASAGGMVREYQVDVDPHLLRHYDVGVMDVVRAIRRSNLDVGAKTIESSGIEFVVRGLGFIEGVADLENVVVGVATPDGFRPSAGMGMEGMDGGDMGGGMDEPPPPRGEGRADTVQPTDEDLSHRPLRVRDLGHVSIGPAFRRGALADEQGERVGGVVVMRFGENPREVIARVRDRIQELNDPSSGALPEGVRITPFYDRTQLIDETVATLETALAEELWITLLVVLVFLLHLRSSLVIASTLPIAVLMSFIAMDVLGVDSNIMSLTGIAIAIGTMVDMGIVMTESIYAALVDDDGRRPVAEVVEEAALEVAPALATAIATTVLTFLPILFLTDMEGKLFRPLAWTKTFALVAAAITGVLVVPVLCRLFLARGRTERPEWVRTLQTVGAPVLALVVGWACWRATPFGLSPWLAGLLGTALGWLVLWRMTRERLTPIEANPVSRFVHRHYERTLRRILANKGTFLLIPSAIVLFGALVTLGAGTLLAPARWAFGDGVSRLRPVAWLEATFPGLGQEFMPSLDEGSLLYMPSLLPQVGLQQTLEVMQRQNAAMYTVPEVVRVVGKLGRAESALDPAPVGMLETVVQLAPREQWRPGLTKEDIRQELMAAVHTPGATEGAGAWLQPIETRVIMLNSDIRAPLAVRLLGAPKGADGRPLDTKRAVAALEAVAGRIRDEIRDVPGVAGPNVENIGAKPYMEFDVDREKAGHYGLAVADVQDAIRTAIGGVEITRTLEGRERYPIRVAYQRELRDDFESAERVLVRGAGGRQIPLSEVATVHQVKGPAAVKTQDGRLRLHVTFAAAGRDEGRVMESVLARIERWRAEERSAGRADPIPEGVSVLAAGRYESQIRARNRFAVLIPIVIAAIFFLLYLNFRDWATALNVFAAAPVVIAGGLILLWAWPGLETLAFDVGWADRPSAGPIHVTVAVVVGFIALLGIATDDGVVLATYLQQTFAKRTTESVEQIRDAVVEAGLRRARPCLMTTVTTILALLPILFSTGTGSDVARPMALPVVGGMIVELVSLFIVPCIYCWIAERRLAFFGTTGEHHEA